QLRPHTTSRATWDSGISLDLRPDINSATLCRTHSMTESANLTTLTPNFITDAAGKQWTLVHSANKGVQICYAGTISNQHRQRDLAAVLQSVPIRQTPARCRVRPRAGIKFSIGRRLSPARDAEQRAEGVERVEPPVEAERELIEVGL